MAGEPPTEPLPVEHLDERDVWRYTWGGVAWARVVVHWRRLRRSVLDPLVPLAVRLAAALPTVRCSVLRGAFWVAVWEHFPAPGERARMIVRIGRPTALLFSERNQGRRGIPIRWHYLWGGRFAIRWEPRR